MLGGVSAGGGRGRGGGADRRSGGALALRSPRGAADGLDRFHVWHAQEDITVVTVTRLPEREDERAPKACLVADAIGDSAMAKIPVRRPSS